MEHVAGFSLCGILMNFGVYIYNCICIFIYYIDIHVYHTWCLFSFGLYT